MLWATRFSLVLHVTAKTLALGILENVFLFTAASTCWQNMCAQIMMTLTLKVMLQQEVNDNGLNKSFSVRPSVPSVVVVRVN